jgi:hypothetical protein
MAVVQTCKLERYYWDIIWYPEMLFWFRYSKNTQRLSMQFTYYSPSPRRYVLQSYHLDIIVVWEESCGHVDCFSVIRHWGQWRAFVNMLIKYRVLSKLRNNQHFKMDPASYRSFIHVVCRNTKVQGQVFTSSIAGPVEATGNVLECDALNPCVRKPS